MTHARNCCKHTKIKVKEGAEREKQEEKRQITVTFNKHTRPQRGCLTHDTLFVWPALWQLKQIAFSLHEAHTPGRGKGVQGGKLVH